VVALGLGLLLAPLAGAGAWYFAPPARHQVRTFLRVPPRSHYFVRTSEVLPDLAGHQRNQVALCKTRLVLSSALRDPDVANLPLLANKIEPVPWLERELKVDFSFAPEIMRIAIDGMETDDLVVLVNAVRKAYIREVLDHEVSVRRQRQAALGELIQKYEDQLTEARKTQKEAAELVGARSAEGRERILAFVQQQLGMTERELLVAQSDLRKARLELDTLREKEKHFQHLKPSELAVAEALAKEEEVLALKAEISRLETDISKTLQRSALEENDPTVIRGREEVRRLETKVRDAGARLRPKIIQKVQERARLDLQAGLSLQQARITILEGTEKMLEPEIQRLRERLTVLRKQGFKQDLFLEDIGYLQDMTKRLRGEHEALKVELMAPSRVAVIEEATVVRVNAQQRQFLLTAGAALAAFLLALVGVAWLEFRSRRIDQGEEVVHGLGLKLLGTVPKMAPSHRTPAGKRRRNDADAQQVLTDSVDAARTLLLHAARSQALRTVMVSSALPGEGKTSLSCRLAVSLARAGLRTLLIDTDTRKPSAHKVFGGPCEPGFCEALCGQQDPSSCLRTTPVANLLFMPAGRPSEQLPVALTRRAASVLFTELGQELDIIIIDSPPILPVADTLQLGQQVDGVLLSALSQVSRLGSLYAASQRLEQLNIRMIGVVVNGVQGQLYDGRYPSTHTTKAAANA
jgi:capsular exopolysaccharide synthesis family protein